MCSSDLKHGGVRLEILMNSKNNIKSMWLLFK